MKIGILGTGMVGATVGTALVRRGHQVMMGSRETGNPKAMAWALKAGRTASQGSFKNTASFAEIVFNCTAGAISLDALAMAGRENLDGKILIDLANPLDMSKGMPPTLTVSNTDSLGERIQAAFPAVKVVKTLNTVNCRVMVEPSLVPGDHTIYVGGNDAGARATVTNGLVDWFGWKRENIIDVGDITSARGTEMLLPLWIRLYQTFGTPNFNFHVVKGQV
jgi:predicted dinucleotide-binding enzyme